MPVMNRQILLASRPERAASADNFRLVEVPLPTLKEGEVLVRNHFLSLDPYMRGRMDDRKSYAAPQTLGEVMQGGTAGVVEQSLNPDWRPGESVIAMFGWQEWGISDGQGMRRVDAAKVPLSAYLGVAGMPGVTAWYGLNRICAPKSGETVVVSAATGAVGSVVSQLAKRHGCRAVGIAGGPAKCRYLVEELRLDAGIDYKTESFGSELAAATQDGIDGYFDNVGGTVLDAVMARMNAHGRIAVCGAISGYDGASPVMTNPRLILTSRLKMQGFIVSEHLDDWPAALAELTALVASGSLKYRESVATGLAGAPDAFLGMLRGKNFGKQLVKLV